jgi:VWFA-related protein
MQPGDLVAVLRTSAGVGALQQFTSDRRILHKAIDRVRWYPLGRGGVAAFAPLGADPMGGVNPAAAQVGSVGRGDAPPGRLSGADEFREDLFAVGTLGALNFIVRGMGELPGRKSVVMFSDGFEIYRGAEFRQSDRVLHSLRRLADLANRAAVAVYTVDARGLTFDGLTAADSTSGLTPEEVERQLNDRRQKYLNTRDGLRYLAEQTGGQFTRNTNDLSLGIRRALEDQKGYYLIGFRPDAEIFDPERGRARRARVVDQATSICTRTGRTARQIGKDLRNRTSGYAHEARSWASLRGEAVSAEQLLQRVRSEMGHVVSHAGAIQVMTDNHGRVTLHGRVLASEADRLLATVKGVTGVSEVINLLSVKETEQQMHEQDTGGGVGAGGTFGQGSTSTSSVPQL